MNESTKRAINLPENDPQRLKIEKQLAGRQFAPYTPPNNQVVATFTDVSKVYTLYRSSKEQFISMFYRSKKLRRHQALDHVSLEVRQGESIGIIGDNGAGKSTLLKMITGVTFPTQGSVAVQGRVSALLELTAGFSDELTGRENIGLKGYILGLNDAQIARLEPKVIEFAELGEYIDQPVRTYSSGMKLRLGFAININTEPDILVVDEALSVGDAKFKAKCRNKINELVNSDITVLYVSHAADSIRQICKRGIYLKKGKVIFDGPVEEAQAIYLADTGRLPNPAEDGV